MGMTPDEHITELIINSENNFETFWSRNIDRIKSIDFSDLRIMAFHVVGALDDCKDIWNCGGLFFASMGFSLLRALVRNNQCFLYAACSVKPAPTCR